MNEYAKHYSIYGLESMIVDAKQEIIDKEKEYNEVEIRYNPLCADGWRKEISKDIERLKNDIIEFEEALKNKL